MLEEFRRQRAAARLIEEKQRAADRLIEEKFYEQVVIELESGERRNGLWAKAVADTDGKEGRAEAQYIKYRVQSLKDELKLMSSMIEEQDRHAHEERKKLEKMTSETNLAKQTKQEEREKKKLVLLKQKLVSNAYLLKESHGGWVVENRTEIKILKSLEEVEAFVSTLN